MSGLIVILAILVLSLVAPFVIRQQRSAVVWVTLFVVNFIIISLFIIVRHSSPDKLSHRDSVTISTSDSK